jgi:hypothetical protein
MHYEYCCSTSFAEHFTSSASSSTSLISVEAEKPETAIFAFHWVFRGRAVKLIVAMRGTLRSSKVRVQSLGLRV